MAVKLYHLVFSFSVLVMVTAALRSVTTFAAQDAWNLNYGRRVGTHLIHFITLHGSGISYPCPSKGLLVVQTRVLLSPHCSSAPRVSSDPA